MKKIIFPVIFSLILPINVNAQESPVLQSFLSDEQIVQEMRDRASKEEEVRQPAGNISMFFTPRELNLLNEARQGLTARLATDQEIRDSQNDAPIPRGPREISVGGILFIDSNDWVVWINAQKITPERIPSEITDIIVSKDSVKLKWFDAYTNQIFPIKLKTHQRFNIDTRIFLPG